MFSLDGVAAGYIKKVSGGTIKGNVATHDLGVDLYQRKHLATIEYTPITVEVGMGMGKGIYEWIRASFDKGHVTKSGEIHACDFDYKSMAIREFHDAFISKVTIPALDGSNKDAAYMTLELDPERIRYVKGTGSQIQGQIAPKTKAWLNSNFRITLGDLPCARVAKVDSFSWEQKVIKDEVGQFRDASKHAAKVTVPNLKFTISMADYEPWSQWHQSFVIDGICLDADELSGQIEFLSPDLKETLGTIELLHVGIFSLEQEAAEANKETVQRFTVELYVEEMKFEPKYTDA